MTNRIRGLPLVLLLAALSMASCGAVRKTTGEETLSERRNHRSVRFEAQAAALRGADRHAREQMQTDSATTRREVAEAVSEERTEMTIPAQKLLSLPDGAKYSAQSGRLSVEAQRQGGQIVVRGRCDSIARRCTYYERRVFRQRAQIDSLTVRLSEVQACRARADSLSAAETRTRQAVARTQRPPATWHWWLLTGFLAGGAASAWLTKTNPLKTFFSLIKKVV